MRNQAVARPREREQTQVELTVVENRSRPRAIKPFTINLSIRITLLVATIIIAMIPFARIWLANDTMRMLVASDRLGQDIATARAEGHRLESQYSAMTNPQTIQRQAEDLGMVPDSDPVYLQYSNDQQSVWDPGYVYTSASRTAPELVSSLLNVAIEYVAQSSDADTGSSSNSAGSDGY